MVVAVAIVVVVATKLSDTQIVAPNLSDGLQGSDFQIINSTCTLAEDYKSSSMCNYVYALAGVSIAVSIAISLLQCCTCNLCGLGGVLDLIFAVAGTAW